MKKRIFSIALALALLMGLCAVPARAATQASSVSPSLYIQGGTVYGSASIFEPGKSISATIELWCGSTKLDYSSDSGTGYVYLSASAPAESGKTYSLYVYGMIGGMPFSITPLSVNG